MTFDNTVSIGDIIAFGAMVISIVFGVISICKSKKAKASEQKAAEYAENADSHNKAAKDYYEKMNEKLEKEELQRRIESVYNPLWEKVRDTKEFLLNDISYYLFKLDNDLSTYGAPSHDVTYILYYIKSAEALIEKTSLNEDMKSLIEKIEEYNSACYYAAQEIEMVYSMVLSSYAIAYQEKYNCERIKIGHSTNLNNLFVLFEALNNEHFYINYLDNSDSNIKGRHESHYLSDFSVNSFNIKEETVNKINGYHHLLEKIIEVKNSFLDIERKLKSIIQYGKLS